MDLDPKDWDSDRNESRARFEAERSFETLAGAAVVGFFAWYFDFYAYCQQAAQWMLSPLFG